MGDFLQRHVYMQWGGTLPGNEIWSCGMRLSAPTDSALVENEGQIPDAQEMVAWVNGSLKDAVAAYHVAAGTKIAAAARLTFLKANVIGKDGRYVQDQTNEYVWPGTGLNGGQSTFVPHPSQVALVVSLTTGFSRGPAHRGRFYLPMPAIAMGADGRIAATDAASVAGTSKTFLEAVADVPGVDTPFDMTPHVMSRKTGAPAQRKVTGVEVGRVLDTQRRRRNKLVEDYSTVVLDLGAA